MPTILILLRNWTRASPRAIFTFHLIPYGKWEKIHFLWCEIRKSLSIKKLPSVRGSGICHTMTVKSELGLLRTHLLTHNRICLHFIYFWCFFAFLMISKWVSDIHVTWLVFGPYSTRSFVKHSWSIPFSHYKLDTIAFLACKGNVG